MGTRVQMREGEKKVKSCLLHQLSELVLNFRVKCIQLLLDRFRTLSRRLRNNILGQNTAEERRQEQLTSNFI